MKYAENQAKAAKELGIALDTLRSWVSRGAPRKTSRGWDLTAIRRWRQTAMAPATRGRRSRSPAEQADADRLLEARANEREALATLAAMREKIQRGDLIHLDAVRDADLARVYAVKRRLLSLGRHLGARLVGLDARAIVAAIEVEARAIADLYPPITPSLRRKGSSRC